MIIDSMTSDTVKLTQYSHGAGCGCKISPKVLDEILKSNLALPGNKNLLVGNSSKDDAAVYNLGNGMALISTTDFFMPIVDDPFDFGRIASANAISDVYAMGGKPVVAIAILGWPINILSTAIAQKVIEGSRSICKEAGIPLAGGHSIDSAEPIFGLAVNGLVAVENIKQNNLAQIGDHIFLTKPLGVGILTTAEKKGILKEKHKGIAAKQMMQLNKAGELLGGIKGVNAMTDVTGFGLLGHLTEMCEGSNVCAEVYFKRVPLLTEELVKYTEMKSIPGGTTRNWDSYGDKITFSEDINKEYATALLADPQTSGGLLIAVEENEGRDVQNLLKSLELYNTSIGRITEKKADLIRVL